MIECSDLTIKYGSNIILDKFNYKFKNNTITAVMGRSGRGKTTLIRAIAGLIRPEDYSGSVFYHDNNKTDLIKKPNQNIFMMHQHYTNFPWKTCFENVMLPLEQKKMNTKESKEKVLKILDKVGLHDYIHKYPYELSGGMNQRLAFARVLIMKPKVLLMDEPMSALDEATRRVMQELLLEMHEECKNIIILVTHSEQEAKILANDILRF